MLGHPLHGTMYSASSSAIPKSLDDEDRRRRGSEIAVNNSQLPPISTRSPPTRYLPFSPTNGTHPPSPYHTYSSRPSTSAAMPAHAGLSPRLGPLPSPKGAASTHGGAAYILRDLSTASTYYDPISEHREGPLNRNSLSYSSNSPGQVRCVDHQPSTRDRKDRSGRADHVLLDSRIATILPQNISVTNRLTYSASVNDIPAPPCAPAQST